MTEDIDRAELVERTGRDLEAWFEILDADRADLMSGKELMYHTPQLGLGAWWGAEVRRAYRAARGVVQVGCEVSCVQRMASSPEAVERAWSTPEERARWLDLSLAFERRSELPRGEGGRLMFRTDDDLDVRVHFCRRSPGSIVRVFHFPLADRAAWEPERRAWKARLGQLVQYLEGTAVPNPGA